MRYIHQLNTKGEAFTVVSQDDTVVTSENYPNIETHPAIVENPGIFEILEGDLPAQCQKLNYASK